MLALKPDILVSDVKMPHMNGTVLLQKLSAAGLRVAVLFISGYSEVALVKSAIRFGASDYGDCTFRPDSQITRSETVTLINRLLNRTITADELKKLGVKNPYVDLVESYWAYGDLIEATVKHAAAKWHKLNYDSAKLNKVVECFVDQEGNESPRRW